MDLQTRRDARSLDHGTLEEMRRLAVRRVKAGESQKSVAESLEVHPRTVSKWYTAERKAGPEALASTKSSGRPPGLTAEERAVLLGLMLAPPAPCGDDLGETGMVVRIDRRDHDPVLGAIAREGLGIAGAGLAGAQHPAVDRLPGIRPAVAQGFLGLPTLKRREEIGPGRCNGSPGGVLFVPTARLPQQGMDPRVSLGREVEPAMTGGRVKHHALPIADRTL